MFRLGTFIRKKLLALLSQCALCNQATSRVSFTSTLGSIQGKLSLDLFEHLFNQAHKFRNPTLYEVGSL